MSTDFKPKLQWEEQDTAESQQNSGASIPLQAEYSRYNFLRNIWGTYFHDRHTCHSQDKLDQINKIVAMMKTQIRFMTEHEKDSKQAYRSEKDVKKGQTMHQLEKQLEKTKQKMEQSQMKTQQLEQFIYSQHLKMIKMQEQNDKLRKKTVDLRQARNMMSQQVIHLSSKLYEIERNQFQEMSLSHVSAVSVDEQEPLRIQIPKKRQSIFQLCDQIQSNHSQQKPEENVLGQINLNINIPNNKHVLKQCYYSQQIKQQKGQRSNDHADFRKQMKRVRQQTERFIGFENTPSAMNYRKTLNPSTARPSIQQPSTRQRRFKRIR